MRERLSIAVFLQRKETPIKESEPVAKYVKGGKK
jgi:hypothetical protein